MIVSKLELRASLEKSIRIAMEHRCNKRYKKIKYVKRFSR